MSTPTSLYLELSGDTEAMITLMQSMPDKMLRAIARGLDKANEFAIAEITKNRMSGKGPFDPSEGKMGVVTGQMRAALRRVRAAVSDSGVESGIGSNLKYMGVHEFGFQGTVHVRGFLRRNKAKDQFVQQVQNGGGRLRKKRVRTVTGFSAVKAHDRKMDMPARAPIGNGVADTASRGVYDREILSQLRLTWEKQQQP